MDGADGPAMFRHMCTMGKPLSTLGVAQKSQLSCSRLFKMWQGGVE
jgi:hypothetical protein